MVFSGIIAAAGLSSHMGVFKPLIEIGGQPVLLQEAETFLSVGVAQVVVVTGHKAEDVCLALKTLPCYGEKVFAAYNPDYERICSPPS